MKLDWREIKEEAEKDFTKAWIKYSKEMPKQTEVKLEKKGKSHPVNDLIQRFREILIEMGFEEVINPTIMPEEEVYLQYGPEAKIILDRVYYLATLPRKELGLGKERIERIKEIIGDFDPKKLQEIFRLYKKGKIEADDLIEVISEKLGKEQELITRLFDSGIFSELLELKPKVTNLTLRSHMTAAWFSTLQEYQDKTYPPIALFSIGLRYRNEQKEDKSHLRVHHSGSIVIMDPEMSLEAGEKITREILSKLGFKEVKFKLKPATSTYYAFSQEKEIFVKFAGTFKEIGDIGMYSPIALSNYKLRYPVFNAGFGIERMASILSKCDDIRKLVYHFRFMEPEVSDEILRKRLRYIDFPKTEIGKKIAERIEKVAIKYKDKIGPCRFLAYEDEKVKVWVEEKEKGKKLLGPAALNYLNIKNCEIYATPTKTENSLPITYLKAISQRIAKLLEDFLSSPKKEFCFQIKLVRSLSDLNLEMDEYLEKYLTSKHKKFEIGGPVFLTVRALKEDGGKL